MKYLSLKGTKDLLPSDTPAWIHVENTVRTVMADFSYGEIRTPVFEQTALFARSIGELTDIVTKEMYTFIDRSEESITLRPEGTASTLRAYVQNNLGEQSPLTKVYYLGPMFRQERPQAGRLRQFHQFGAEALGSNSHRLDVEMMMVPLEIYRRLGITETTLKINSVGCEKCRPRYKELLKSELLKIRQKLSADSQNRIEQNPLRVLDSKDESDQRLTAGLPLLKDHLCQECKVHFDQVQKALSNLHRPYVIDGHLVRGLDYYTKTAFEITSPQLGAQDALAGGGRYDLLVEELGGKPTPGVGFAAGMERLMIALEKTGKDKFERVGPVIFLVALNEPAREWAFAKCNDLRSKGISADMDYLERSVKAQMREANRLNCRYVAVIGEEELKSGSAKLKDMRSGEERVISLKQFDSSL